MTTPASTYLLPIRRAAFSASEAAELADYFRMVTAAGCEVLVVDGSPAPVFAQNAAVWNEICRHEAVNRRFGYRNDKVNGIHTGVELARCEKIVLADDDIRYDAGSLGQIAEMLDRCEVVRPQNFLAPLPWWAEMEAARMLINRATLRTGDYPGTCAFRRATFLAAGAYDGDVLFDNEEIIRHFAESGAKIIYALDLFVRKRPPTWRKWIEQRPRQAYEDFGMRAKTTLFFALPLIVLASAVLGGKNVQLNDRSLRPVHATISLRQMASRISLCLAGITLVSSALALGGWRRGRARNYFPVRVVLFAPLWVCERALSTYWALYWFLVYGGYPFGGRILSRGVGRAWRRGGRIAARAARGQVAP
jgi:glycosyl transferase family 21